MKTLPRHMFASSTDGALYDTRRADWAAHFPLRRNYCLNHADIKTVAELKATLRAGPYAWPGGYPVYFVTADGAALAFETVREEFACIVSAIRNDDNSGGWRVVDCEVNWEDTDLICAHSGKKIDSAYGDEGN